MQRVRELTVKIRKDSWSSEEDNLLKELVLKNIEQGHTQLSAFQEASVLLGRSKQACAFRWNKNLRPTLVPKEVYPKEVPDSTSLQNHLQLAMNSYDEMKQSYEEILKAHMSLKKEYELLENWLKQGMTYIGKRS